MKQRHLDNQKNPAPCYALHCDACGFHKVTDGTDCKLVEMKVSPIQRTLPSLANQATSQDSPRSKMFKCPKCGRGITAKKSNVKVIPHIQQENKNEQESEDNDTGRQTGSFGRAISPDFTG